MGSYPPTLIVITGPTASGKSALAVDVAERLHTEIISADSRQIYQGIPIVTAMPTPEERRRVPHHLVDMLPLDAYYSASEFEQDALSIIRRLLADRGVAVVCGGSMMYVDALCNGIDDLPTVPDHIRSGLKEEHEARGDEWLLDTLSRLDPEYFRMVDRCNIKRVFHAVEIIRASGEKYSRLRTGRRVTRDFRILKICLDAPRELLFDRINRRVDQMMAEGLMDEARRVLPYREQNALNTVGYKELFRHLDGEWTLDLALEKIRRNSRVYAKKQMTWFKKDAAVRWFHPSEADAIRNYIAESLD